MFNEIRDKITATLNGKIGRIYLDHSRAQRGDKYAVISEYKDLERAGYDRTRDINFDLNVYQASYKERQSVIEAVNSAFHKTTLGLDKVIRSAVLDYQTDFVNGNYVAYFTILVNVMSDAPTNVAQPDETGAVNG